MKKIMIGLLLVLTVFLAGCSKASSSAGSAASSISHRKMVGKWQVDSSMTLEFFEDGTCEQIYMGTVQSGTYEFLDGDTIYLDIPGSIQYEMEVSFSGDMVTLSTGAEIIELKRIN